MKNIFRRVILKGNILLSILLLPLVFYALQFSADYNFDYYYFQNINYFSSNDIKMKITSENDFANFHMETQGRFYTGVPRYYISYPPLDSALMTNLTASIQLKNTLQINQIYLSLYHSGFNLKIGKFPVKWGISEVYSPADIFRSESPFNLLYIDEGINCIQLNYSRGNINAGFLYKDSHDGLLTKPGLTFEIMNRYFTASLYAAHYYSFEYYYSILFMGKDTTENVLLGINAVTDNWGPGIWAELDCRCNITGYTADDYEYSDITYAPYMTIGADYTFFDRLYLSGEYVRNFKGNTDVDDFDQLNRLFNDTFLIGRDYMFFVAGFNRNEKISSDIVTMFNLNDFSNFTSVKATYAPRLYFSTSVSITFGKGGRHTDFFTIPPIYGLNVKYLFN